MTKITTIGGGNGQSNLLSAFNEYLGDDFDITSIVSMSDDGRTTGELIRNFKSTFDTHLPPPGDLRKCFYSSSKSKYILYFKNILENIFFCENNIKDLTILDLFKLSTTELFNNFGKEIKSEFSSAPVIVDSNFSDDIIADIKLFLENETGPLYEELKEKLGDYFDFKLLLDKSIRGHKFGNIMMASIYYNLDNYSKMIEIMHDFLCVKGNIIPVTIERAFIKAKLENGDIIETQDHISNDAEYTSKIVDLELMDCSKDAKHHAEVDNAIVDSDYLIIAPGDLFTSTISNFIIGGVKESIKNSNAKIIIVGNNTNKGGETQGFKVIDFLNQIEKYLGKTIDYFVTNDEKIILNGAELEKFKTNVSVQGGDFLFLSGEEKDIIQKRGTKIILGDLIDKNIFYKHDKKNISKIIYELIKNEHE